MINSKFSTFERVIQTFINITVVILVFYLLFFAFQGERYTAFDGKVEKHERITADQIEKDERISAIKILEERIIKLENMSE